MFDIARKNAYGIIVIVGSGLGYPNSNLNEAVGTPHS